MSQRTPDDEAVRLTMVIGGRPAQLTVSVVGSVALFPGVDGAPTVESIVDYVDEQVMIEDYADQTYAPMSLLSYVSQQQAILSVQGHSQASPAQCLYRTPLREKIAGISARAYLATINGNTSRIWYAEDLPLPPESVRRKLEAIGPLSGKGDCDASAGDDDRCGHKDGCNGDEGRVTAMEVAGYTILRTETQDVSGGWTIVNDTLDAAPARVGPSDFAVPMGWVPTSLPGTPPVVSVAYDSISKCTAQNDPTTTVGFSGGALLQRVQVYVNYIGAGFKAAKAADPAGFDSVFTAGISQALTGQYYAGLQEYGIRGPAQVIKTSFFTGVPSGAFSDFLVDQASVVGLQYGGVVPSLWWKTDKSAPLVFLVYDDANVSGGGYGGYHVAAPSASWSFLPFPLDVLAFPLIPYASVVVPHAALSVTAAMLAQRDATPLCGGTCDPVTSQCTDNCASIFQLDTGTMNMSHETVEALTDPFPFSGWANPNLVPAWNDGELADICQLSCPNSASPNRWTRQGNTALASYYSTSSGMCVGWQSSVYIVAPRSSDIPWVAGGPKVTASVSITDPLSQGVLAAAHVSWSIDGTSASLGSPTSLTFGSLGTHTVTAFFQDPESDNTAFDQTTVDVVDVPPHLSITSPNDGATFVQGTPFALSGSATNLDYPSGAPGFLLQWFVDDATAGTGSSVAGPSLALGDHMVTLSFTDSAGVVGTLSHTIHIIPAGSLPFRKQIAANNSHTCGLLPDGTAKCWGNDSWGELGDGQTLVSLVPPVAVAGFSGGVSLAAGQASTCALIYDGTVRCWGDNPAGELGDGTTAQSTTPVVVSGLTGATGIAMGNHHACAIVAGGAVVCWGSNGSGQVGDGTTTSRSTPVLVPGLSGVAQLAAGGWWTCALLSDGTVSCWGDHYYGPSLTDGINYGLVPVPIVGVSNAVAISAGEYQACAVLSDTTVSCWGGNNYGQLGDGTMTNRATPRPVVGLANVASIASGNFHTCAVLSDSTAQCWGDGIAGQLGNGSAIGSQPAPSSVVGLTGVTALAAGAEYTCSLLAGGSAACWGSNFDGQLGNASVPTTTGTFGTATPVPVIGWP